MGAAAHSVTFNAGRASPFFAIDDRHSGMVDGRMRSWVLARSSCAVMVQGLRTPTEIKQRPTASEETLPVVDKDTVKKKSIENSQINSSGVS